MMVFVCHPYHRGGVTSWMSSAFLESKSLGFATKFITVNPKKPFISGGNRPKMVSLVGESEDVHDCSVGLNFELATNEYRIDVYRKLILAHVPFGSALIPSDDEVVWKACLSLSKNYKVVGILHSDDPFYYSLYKNYRKYLSAIVSVSKRIKTVAEKLGSIPHHEVIPCGIKLDTINPPGNKLNHIIWIGRVEEEQKRVSDIIPISVLLKLKTLNWKLLVFGDGSKLNELKELSKKNGLDSHIEFFGWVNSEIIESHLKKAKVILQTSNYEGMSVAIMEGLGAGCAVVSSEVSGVEDLLSDSAAEGLVRLYPVGDTDLAAQQISDSLFNYSEETEKNAMLLADRYFSIQNCVENYKDLIERLEFNSNELITVGLFFKIKVKFSGLIVSFRYLKYKLLS